jgi:hypothetical protein
MNSLYITTEQFFAYEGLNWHNPDLRETFKLAEEGHYDEALEALVRHFKQRRNPLWTNTDRPPRESSEDEERLAASLPERWLDRGDSERRELVVARSDIAALVLRYHTRGNVEDGAVLKGVIHWIHDRCLPPSYGDARRAPVDLGTFWNPLHCCGWVKEHYGFLSQLQLLLRNDHLDGETLRKAIVLVIALVRSIMLHPTGRNCVFVNCLLLAQAGVFLPELTDSYWWRREAMIRSTSEFDAIFYPDGGQVEHSSGYNGFTVKVANHFLMFCDWVGTNLETVDTFGENWERSISAGLPLSPDTLWKLRRAIRFYGLTAMPNFVVPPLGDVTSGNVGATTMERIGELLGAQDRFPEDPHIAWVSTGGQEGHPPGWTSAAYPYMGYFCMRTGWERDDTYCLFDSGSMGEWHGHDDMLAFVLYSHGRMHGRESGYYGGWCGSEHNTVLIDGKPPSRRHGPETMHLQLLNEPYESNRWQTTPDFDYASGVYDGGWTNPKQPDEDWPRPVRHMRWKRAIFFAKPDIFFVSDFLWPIDGDEHEAAAIFHLSGEKVEREENCFRTINTRPSRTSGVPADEPPSTIAAWTVCPGSCKSSIILSGDDPAAPVGAETLDERVSLEPLPVLATHTRVNEPIALLHVFVPIPESRDCRIEEVKPLAVESESVDLATGASLRFADGRHFRFVQLAPDSLESHDAFLIESSPAAHPAKCRAKQIPKPANGGRGLVAKGRTLNGIRRSASEGEIEAWLDGYRCYPEQ